jgi:MEDS: MEthanogen/methylotroph, DcmR Sensory domain
MTEMARRSAQTAAHHHSVQFYSSDDSLCATVATFLAEGLVASQPAIVIATQPHRAKIVRYLCDRLIDCEAALKEGDLVILDSEEMLDLFMVDGMPNKDLFAMNLGRVIDQSINGRTGTVVRAYGEMVDVLWKRGQIDSAIALEILWNKLALKYHFALLCGYSMGSFYKQPHQLDAIRLQHTHVVPSDSTIVPFERHTKSA